MYRFIPDLCKFSYLNLKQHSGSRTDCLNISIEVESLNDCLLEQMLTSPTGDQNILDLLFTTNPTLLDNVSITQGLSDHGIVLAQVNAKPEITKQVPCNIPLNKKADWDQLKTGHDGSPLLTYHQCTKYVG